MGMSTATFNRKFKKAFGLPVGKWINAKRKINVLIDLKTTDMTIKDIAAKYNLTPNYLTNFCKKQLGNVPANIRRGFIRIYGWATIHPVLLSKNRCLCDKLPLLYVIVQLLESL